MPIKNIIFDWNGTLVDDFSVVCEAINLTLENLGKKRVSDEYQRKGYERDPQVFYQKLGVNEPKDKVWSLYNDNLNSLEHPAVTREVKDILTNLKSKGLRLFVISASPSSYLMNEIKKNGLFGVFPDKSCIIGDCHDKVKVLKSLNLDNAAFVGDTYVDIEAGKKCGFKTIALLGGYNTEEQIINSNPDQMINSLKELLELL